jgi:hypothetical protein
MQELNTTIVGEIIRMHIKIFGPIYSGTPRFNFSHQMFIVFTYKAHLYYNRYLREELP